MLENLFSLQSTSLLCLHTFHLIYSFIGISLLVFYFESHWHCLIDGRNLLVVLSIFLTWICLRRIQRPKCTTFLEIMTFAMQLFTLICKRYVNLFVVHWPCYQMGKISRQCVLSFQFQTSFCNCSIEGQTVGQIAYKFLSLSGTQWTL